MPKRGKRSAGGAMRHRMRGVENELERMARQRRRDPRDAGLDAMQLSRQRAGISAAQLFTGDSTLKDTRDGVMHKGINPKRASDKQLRGSAKVPNDLRVSVEVWDAETDARRVVMVPVEMKAIAAPPTPVQTDARTTREKYLGGW